MRRERGSFLRSGGKVRARTKRDGRRDKALSDAAERVRESGRAVWSAAKGDGAATKGVGSAAEGDLGCGQRGLGNGRRRLDARVIGFGL